MISNWKTSAVGALKILAAVGFVVLKVIYGSELSQADIGFITLAVSGGLGNILSADSKKETS